MKTLILENGGTQLFTMLYANESMETVILLHGGPGVPDALGDVAGLLKEKYQVICFFQRGTALSPCSEADYSMEAYVSDINAIASHFKLERFHLFGHSWGGLYAQIYASRFPNRILSLFLCSPGSGTGAQWRETQAEVLRFNRSRCTFTEWMIMGINSLLGLLGSSKAYQRLFAQAMKNYNKGYVISRSLTFDLSCIKAVPVNQTLRTLLKYPLLQNERAAPYPVTITYGDGDIYGNSKKYVRRRYPTGLFRVIEHSGHLPWLHNYQAFQAALLGHFK